MQILNKNKALLSLIALLSIIFVAGMIFDYKALEIEASATDNVSGWAWSENIGWISFNCTDTSSCGSSNYGININQANGDFSGYGWSENIGWIDFAPSSGYPESPSHGARLESDNTVTGWAKALSADGNGWDGWIKMSGSWANGVSRSGSNLIGYAWGSDVVGWVQFNPAFGGVAYGGGAIPPPGECNDGIDNADVDLLIDMADPGCLSPLDTSEDQAPNFILGFAVGSSDNLTADLLSGQPVTSTETSIKITMADTGDPAFSGPIQLSVLSSDLPGATYNWSQTVINSPYSDTVTFSVNVPAGTPDGSYTINIKGEGGGSSDTVPIYLNSSTKNIRFEEL